MGVRRECGGEEGARGEERVWGWGGNVEVRKECGVGKEWGGWTVRWVGNAGVTKDCGSRDRVQVVTAERIWDGG